MPHGLGGTDLKGAQLHLYGRRSEGGNAEQKLCVVSLASSSQAGYATYLYVELQASVFLTCSEQVMALVPEALCR